MKLMTEVGESAESDNLNACFTSDLFMLAYEAINLDDPWVAWAECAIDAMHQAVVRFHTLNPVGFGHDEYDWVSSLYLRRNRVTECVEFLVEEDGYGDLCSVEKVWDQIDEDLWEDLVGACYEGDAKAAFDLLLAIAGDSLHVRELTAEDEERIKHLPIMGYTARHSAQLRDQAAEIAASLGLEPVPFNKVVKKFKEFRSGEATANADAVYLPDRMAQQCTTDASKIPGSSGRWFALTVDRSVAHPEYLAGMLNTRLGMTIRESMETTHLPRLRPERFRDAVIYLPPLPNQKQIVQAIETIRTLGLELGELSGSLWERPAELDSVLERLAVFDPLSSFAGWLDSLPFPLASILWSYHVLGEDAEKRTDKLLHFFEALVEYVATIMVSAFAGDESRWGGIRDKIQTALDSQSLSITRATFGTWTCMLGILAKETRTLVADKPADALNLYRTRDLKLIKALSAKELVSILQEANGWRNNWTGHGGAVGQREAERRHETLRNRLEQVRETFGAVWKSSPQLRPGKAEYDGRRYLYDCELVVGTRTPFVRMQLTSSEPLESNRLYLWGSGDDRGLKLAPFIKIMPSPKTEENACYYFNRLDGGGSRYLSYHFAADSDITLADGSDVLQTLVDLGLAAGA